MPLHTQIYRDEKPLQLKWGMFHVAAMAMAASLDSGSSKSMYDDPADARANALRLMEAQDCIGVSSEQTFMMGYHVLGATPLNDGSYTLQERWVFVDNIDGERLELLPGDRLVAERH